VDKNCHDKCQESQPLKHLYLFPVLFMSVGKVVLFIILHIGKLLMQGNFLEIQSTHVKA